MESYYRKQYKDTGQIPKGLYTDEGRKYSGRKASVSEEIEKRFVQMVTHAADPDHPEFLTKNLRRVATFHAFLEAEFQTQIPLHGLYRLVNRNKLKSYLNKPDRESAYESGENRYYFKASSPFDLIQMDGCTMHYFQIRDGEEWKKPIWIEIFDTGSRYMFVTDLYFSESSENATNLFCQFLRSTVLPQKTIRFRPDNAKGFLSLKRPLTDLNQRYSLPGRFFLDADFARVQRPKDKVHLESSHRKLHNFEAWIIRELRAMGKFVENVGGTKFYRGQMVPITVARFNITLEELKASGLPERYRTGWNDTEHKFSEEGRRKTWIPTQKLQEWLDSQDHFRCSEADLEGFYRYGYTKYPVTITQSGRITYRGREYVVITEDLKHPHSSRRVKASLFGERLFLFEDRDDGVCLGEAVPTQAPPKPQSVEKKAEKRREQNEYELIVTFLEKNGMSCNRERLAELYRKGLTLAVTMQLVQENLIKYEKYKGFIAFNLFVSDFMRIGHKEDVKPYAHLQEA